MKTFLVAALLVALTPASLLLAELPPQIKHQAEQYDQAMAAYDLNITTRMAVDRDTYLARLKYARRIEAGGKRLPAVAAIDTEIAAVEAGQRPKDPPPNFPKTDALLSNHREKYITSQERAEQLVASSRRFTRESYLKFLTGTAAAIKGKGAPPELEAAIAKEIARVNASIPENKEPAE